MGNACSSTNQCTPCTQKEKFQCVSLITNIVSERQYPPVWGPRKMSKILDHLYVGSYLDATDLNMLRKEGITHVINTVEHVHECCCTGSVYYGCEFKYLGFTARDEECYPIMSHFEETYKFIEHARETGGKCLIHCMAGINRSGALAVAYVMVHKNIGPVTATRIVFSARKPILTNEGFIRRLVTFAAERKYLEKDIEEIDATYASYG